jgi:hypothetical protein
MKKFVTWYLDHSVLAGLFWICLAIVVLVIAKSLAIATLTLLLCIPTFILFDYLEDSSFLKEEGDPDSKYRWVRIGDTVVRLPRNSIK